MRSFLVLLPLAVIPACAEPVQCGSTHGFVFGNVTGDTLGDLRVVATSPGQDDVAGEVSGGTYELNVQGGSTWTVLARADLLDPEGRVTLQCASEEAELRVEACAEQQLDLVVRCPED